MRLGLLVWAVVAVMAAPAGAVGYDDFSRGLTANLRGENDLAIGAFTAALASGDLAAAYKPEAHRGLVRAYLNKGQCKIALADADAAVTLAPSDQRSLRQRIPVRLCLKDFAGVVADYEALMGKVPDADLYFEAGRVLWGVEAFADASTTFSKALALAPKPATSHETYTVIWYALSQDRQALLDTAVLAGYADTLPAEGWPRPLLNLFLGKNKPEQIEPMRHGTEAVGQTCEANFYIGEWYIARGNTELAKPLIADAAAKCPKSYTEYAAAQAEARRLGLPKEPRAKE